MRPFSSVVCITPCSTLSHVLTGKTMGNSGTDGSPGPALRLQEAGLSCVRITTGDLGVAWPGRLRLQKSKLVWQGALLSTPTPPWSPSLLGFRSGVPFPLSLRLSTVSSSADTCGEPLRGFSLRLCSPGWPGWVEVWGEGPVSQDLCTSSESRSLMTQNIPFPARQQPHLHGKMQVVNHFFPHNTH